MDFSKERKSPDEMLDIIIKNGLMEGVFMAINNNHHGYGVRPAEAEIACINGKTFLKINGPGSSPSDAGSLIQIPELQNTEYAANYIPGSRHNIMISRKDDTFNVIFSICKTKEEEKEKLAQAVIIDYLKSCGIDSMRKLRFMVIQACEISGML